MKLTVRQFQALDVLATSKHALENEMGVRLSTVRSLVKLGFATSNEFNGRYGDAKNVTHWNARITEAGRAYYNAIPADERRAYEAAIEAEMAKELA